MAYKDLTFLLFAKDMSATRGFEKVALGADRMSAGVSGAMGMAGVAIAGLAISLTAKSVKMAADFQQASTRLVTDAGESAGALKKVQSGMLDVSAATGLSAEDTVKSMYLVESAGYHGAKGIATLKAVAEGSVIGMADANTVADALTTTMTDFGKAAGSPAHAMSELIATVSTGKTTMEALAGSLHSVLPAAASAGLGLNEVLAAVGTMTAEGISADQATQNLNHSILSLQAPSQVATKAMAGIGVSSLDVAKNLGKRGLAGTYDVLFKAMSEHSKAGMVVVKAFGDSAQASASMKTALAQMPPSLRAVSTEFQHGQLTSKQWAADLKQYPATTANLGRQFATLVKHSTGFSDALKSGSGPIRTTAAQLEKMLGGTTGLQVALHLTGDHMGTFIKNTKTVGSATTEAGGHVKGWAETQKNFNVVQGEFNAEIGKFGIELGTTVLPALTDFTRNLIDGGHQWGQIFAATGKWFSGVVHNFQDGFNQISGAVSGTVHNFSAGFHQIEGFFTGLIHNFQDGANQMSAIGQHIVSGFLGGITGAWGAVTSTVTGLVNAIPLAVRKLLGIASPSKVFKEIGGWVGKGLEQGLLGSTGQVSAAATSLATAVRTSFSANQTDIRNEFSHKQISKSVEQSRLKNSKSLEASALADIKTMTNANSKLARLGKERTAVLARETALKGSRSAVYNDTTGATRGYGDVTGFGAPGDAVQGLAALVTKTKTFTADLKSLQHRGMSGALLTQLVNGWNSNPDTALTTANGLLANPTDLREIMGLQSQLASAGASLGSYAAHSEYDSQIRASSSKAKVLAWEMQRAAESGLRKVAHETHVHINLSGHYAGTKDDLAKTITQVIRDAEKKGIISKNWNKG